MAIAVDIVLPCYNPNDKWHLEVLKFYDAVKSTFQLRFIVVNDGSTSKHLPDTIKSLHENNVPLTLLSYEVNRGKGYALRHGISQASAEYVLYTDIDLPFTHQSMVMVLNSLISGAYDVVAGYREENYYENKMSGSRKLLSKTFRSFLRNVLRLPLTDTQAGLKAFNQKGKKIFLSTRIDRYLFDFEFIYLACHQTSVKIGTIPVQLKNNVVFSKMPLKVLAHETINLVKVLMGSRRIKRD